MIYLQITGIIISFLTIVWVTSNELKKRKRIQLEYEQGICYQEETMTMYTSCAVRISNNSTNDILIKKIGFTSDKTIIPVELINGEKINTSRFLDADNFIQAGTIKNAEKIPEEIECRELFSRDKPKINPGSSVIAYFNFKDLKKSFLKRSNRRIYAYCIDQIGRKSKVKVNRGLVLSSTEPV
ncbi:MAG: hypothetical protein KAW92_12340 [Candidatus Cloacimonetes bacterium]|nr:hypothetical protein [Candidatus Cloacimonadota bacterium]